MPAVINLAVEGPTDEAVAVRLIHHVGAEVRAVYGKNGKQALRTRISGFNNAARHAPWIVLVDLDHDADCAPPLKSEWLPEPAPGLCFRVAVRAIEAWLLADPDTIAEFLGIARRKVPALPETLDHPKTALVNLARTSRREDIRLDMVPREGSGRSIGPAYTSRLIEFTGQHWRPDQAAGRADSLRRAIACLERLIEASA